MDKLQVLEVQKFMMDIVDEHPLCLEYETDARDIWPKRWESLRKKLLESASQPAVEADAICCAKCGYTKSEDEMLHEVCSDCRTRTA